MYQRLLQVMDALDMKMDQAQRLNCDSEFRLIFDATPAIDGNRETGGDVQVKFLSVALVAANVPEEFVWIEAQPVVVNMPVGNA